MIPLGALSILLSALCSTYFLNESLKLHGQIGYLLQTLRFMIVVIHTSKEENSLNKMSHQLSDPGFVAFEMLAALVPWILTIAVGPKSRQTFLLT